MKKTSYQVGSNRITIEILDSGELVLKGPNPDGSTSDDDRGRTAEYGEAFPDTEQGRTDFFTLFDKMAAVGQQSSKTQAQDFLANARS